MINEALARVIIDKASEQLRDMRKACNKRGQMLQDPLFTRLGNTLDSLLDVVQLLGDVCSSINSTKKNW